MRKAIPVQERLAVTLRFLATGDSFKSLSYLFKVSTHTVARCVHETCVALIDVLKHEIKVNYCFYFWLKKSVYISSLTSVVNIKLTYVVL